MSQRQTKAYPRRHGLLEVANQSNSFAFKRMKGHLVSYTIYKLVTVVLLIKYANRLEVEEKQ